MTDKKVKKTTAKAKKKVKAQAEKKKDKKPQQMLDDEHIQGLTETAKKYHDYYENTPDLQVSVDAVEGRIIECNETAARATGYSKSEIIGKKVFEMYHPSSLEKARECFRKFVETGRVHDEELQLQCKDGSIIDVLLNVTAYKDQDGKHIYSRSVWHDISERKKAESLLKKAKEETDKANAKLKELDQLKSMFIASMSHELRTPLNSIIGFSGMMINETHGKLNVKQKDYTQRIYKSGLHLLNLITDVIDISKIEAGRVDVLITSFPLGDVVNEAVNLTRLEAEKKGLTLDTRFPAKLEMVTDQRLLLQCMVNYLSNAVKYTEVGGITITIEERDGRVRVEVADTGIGIATADKSLLFEAFERLETNLRIKAGGTGLGLHLTRKIVTEILQGTIGFDSIVGKGSRFWFEVPQRLNYNN